MRRHLPRFKYNGLTVILSNPSRFDKDTDDELLTATGGYYFNHECLSPITNRFCCDIRLADDPSPLIKDTKCVLVLGQYALTKCVDSMGNLEELRGSPLLCQGIPTICSFLPQDAVDPKNYEKDYNPGVHADGDFEEDSSEEVTNEKSHSRTARTNYRFWLKKDTLKALTVITSGVPNSRYTPIYHIYPPSSIIIDLLNNTKNKHLYIDIETDPISMDMRCVGFSFGADEEGRVNVYVVPTLDINYKPAYAELSKIMLALFRAFQSNTVVAHNGHCFDFFVFAYKYHIPIGKRVFDTLIAQQRIYPVVERSLGHCVSLWTWEKFHKGEADHSYRTQESADKLYHYNGKDVYTLFLVHTAQVEFALTIPGLMDSINQANASIRPYLISTLLGMKYDEAVRQEMIKRNDRWMMQMLRVMRILHGKDIEPLISNKKCVEYFHNQLDYPVIKRSSKTGMPSLAKDILYKLRLGHENPVIDTLISYRETQKETGTLQFEPWIKEDERAHS